jgi:transposase-like protein
MATRINWEGVREEYVQGSVEVTIESLSRKHGISASTIKQRAWKEQWVEQRRQLLDAARTKARERTATQLADVMSRHGGMARMLINLALRRLKDVDPDELRLQDALGMLMSGMDIEMRVAGGADTQLSDQVRRERLGKILENMSVEDLLRVQSGQLDVNAVEAIGASYGQVRPAVGDDGRGSPGGQAPKVDDSPADAVRPGNQPGV